MNAVTELNSRVDTYKNSVREKNDIFYVKPLQITDCNFMIFCPHCFGFHKHGKMYGHRLSHCQDPGHITSGYVIVPDLDDKTISKYIIEKREPE
jgi:hypothetical protein